MTDRELEFCRSLERAAYDEGHSGCSESEGLCGQCAARRADVVVISTEAEERGARSRDAEVADVTYAMKRAVHHMELFEKDIKAKAAHIAALETANFDLTARLAARTEELEGTLACNQDLQADTARWTELVNELLCAHTGTSREAKAKDALRAVVLALDAPAVERGDGDDAPDQRSRDAEVTNLRERIAAVEQANITLTARLNAKNAELLAARIALQDAVDAATPLLTDAHALAMLKGVVLEGVERLNHEDMRMARRSCEDVIPGEQLLNVAANLSMAVAQAVDDLRSGEKTDPMRGRAGS